MAIFGPNINVGGVKKAGKAALKGIQTASTVARAGNEQANAALTAGKKEALGYLNSGTSKANDYYNMAANLYNPMLSQDQGAWNTYRGSLGLGTPEDRAAAVGAFQHSPGYQAALDEAQQGVLRHFADTGGVANGNVLRQLQTVAQNAQNQDYGNWQSQLAANFNPHQDLSALTNIYGNQAGAATDLGANQAKIAAGTAGNISNNYVDYSKLAAGLANQQGQQTAQNLNDVNNAKYQNSSSNWSDILGLGKGILGLFG